MQKSFNLGSTNILKIKSHTIHIQFRMSIHANFSSQFCFISITDIFLSLQCATLTGVFQFNLALFPIHTFPRLRVLVLYGSWWETSVKKRHAINQWFCLNCEVFLTVVKMKPINLSLNILQLVVSKSCLIKNYLWTDLGLGQGPDSTFKHPIYDFYEQVLKIENRKQLWYCYFSPPTPKQPLTIVT